MKLKYIIIVSVLLAGLVLPNATLALGEDPIVPVQKTFDNFNLIEVGGFASGDPLDIAGSVIGIVLSFVGLIFLLLVIYAGFVLIFANGDESKIDTARKIITAAVLGLMITLASYGIAYLVFTNIDPGTVGSGADGSCSGVCVDNCNIEERDEGMGSCDAPGKRCCVPIDSSQCDDIEGFCMLDNGFFGTGKCEEGYISMGQLGCGYNAHCCIFE